MLKAATIVKIINFEKFVNIIEIVAVAVGLSKMIILLIVVFDITIAMNCLIDLKVIRYYKNRKKLKYFCYS